MNRNVRIGLLAAAVSACLAAPSAFAAEPNVVVEAGPSGPALISSERLIVTYKDAQLSSSVKLGAVNSAARRAHAAQMGIAVGRDALAPTAAVVRRLGTGAELLRLSKRVSSREMNDIVAEVAADPSVASVQVDRLLQHTADVTPQYVPNDPGYTTNQWHLKNTPGGANVEAARDKATGAGVVVAVIDTGITSHPDLDANVLSGYDFITDATVSRRADNTRVPGGADLGDWTTAGDCGSPNSAPRDSSWHGTHVSGTIAEVTNNGVGMAGVAPGAKVLPVRVLGRCGGYTSDIADAITWASGGDVTGIIKLAKPAEVINMSLGGSGSCDPLTQAAIDGAVSRGTLVVVAAGNSNGEVANFTPASCNNVVSVAAVGITGARASYSNYGALIDLAAPGGGGGVDGNPNGYVWQTRNGGKTSPTAEYIYSGFTGTSMASPHVAGVAALVQSVAPKPLTPAALEILLKENVRPFPATPDHVIGTGLLDATLAVTAAITPPGEQPAIPLTDKVAVVNVSGAAGGTKLYSIAVPAGARLLNLMTYGGTGDVSLYASRDVRPTTSLSQWKSSRPGNNETIRVSNPVAGTYYMLVSGETNFSQLSVTARID